MKKINFRWLFYPFLAFILGLNISRKVFAGNIEFIIILSVLVLGIGIFCIFKKYFKRLIVLFMCLILGMGYYFIGQCEFNCKDITGKVAVVGRITDNVTDNGYSYTIVLDDVEIDGERAGNVSVQLSNCDQLPEVGSKIAFESELTCARPYTLDRFNSSVYRSGVRYYTICNFDYAVVSEGYQKLDEKIRLAVKDLLYENMSASAAETAYASLFGDKNNLDGEIYSAYQAAGIIHILTVSGLHVGFLISLIYAFLKLCRVNKYVNFAITTIFIIFYAYLCNFSPSVLRAGVMGIVFMISKLCYRRYDGLNSLGLAGFLLCLFRPLNGLDVGFLMSVFCVMSIFVVMPILSKWLGRVMPKKVGDVFAVSIAAQIGIVPMLCMMSGGINLLSIFANFLIVPLFSIVYPLLFVLVFLGLIFPFIAKCLILVEYAFTLIFLIAKFFAHGPIITLKRLDFAKILLFYTIFFVISDYFMALPKERLLVFACLILAYAIAFGGYYFKGDNLSTISYISQYNSSSIVLKNSKGNVLVVGDCFLLDEFSIYSNGGFDIFVARDKITQERYGDLAEMGFSNFICYEEGFCSENEVLTMDSNYVVGGFEITYLSNGDELGGVRVNFDNLEIFIASKEDLSYNEFEKLDSKYNFDVVFADYPLGTQDFIHISTKYVECSDYNFNSIGNMAFDGMRLRRLD